MRVQIFTWEGPDGVKQYSVDAALEGIRRRPRPTVDIYLADAQEGLRRNYHSGELDNKHVAKADLAQPLIFITVPEKGRNANILIDGWHRLKKMVLLGRTEPLQAYILTPVETQCVEVGEIIYG